LIVEWRGGRSEAALGAGRAAADTGVQALATALPGWRVRALAAGEGRWLHLAAPQPLSRAAAQAWAESLRRDPRVAAVAPDVREQRLDVTPADARWAEQWWLQSVAAGNTGAAGFTRAWMRSTGAPTAGAGAVVAVLDSGITSHPELNPRLLPGWDFVANAAYANDGDGRDNDPADPGDWISEADRIAQPDLFGGCPAAPRSSWHGTTIAGQVAAVSNNAEGVAAGNWNGRVVPVRVAGRCGAAVSDIVDGLRWAAGLPVAGAAVNPNPARVIVLGYGGIDACDVNSASPEVAATARLYTEAIDDARRAGALVVVAAGNQRSAVGRPASCAGAFGVTSVNREGFKAVYANFGPQIALATPGGDRATNVTCDAELADTGVVSTGNLGDTVPGAAGYAAASGTSFAAPAVAAAATLMLAVNPALTVEQIEDGLRRSARPHAAVPLLGACSLAPGEPAGRCACTTATCGAGLLDADEALRFAEAPAAYAAPVRTGVVLDDARIRACAVLLGRPVPPDDDDDDGGGSDGDGGGGATSVAFLLGLALAAALLRRQHPGAPGPRDRGV
jgi:serine protease